MIGQTPLRDALQVNGQVRCDCGCTTFEVGVAYSPHTGNNFIRLLQCTVCGKQMPAVHRTDAGLAPSLALPAGGRAIQA